MGDKSPELARRWLEKADHDLITARQTLLLPDGPTDTVCFHAQQAVEKALKAWLTFRRVTFPRIHNLVRLLDICLADFPDMEQHRESLAELSNYATEIRYPDASVEPPRDEATHALALAEGVVTRIKHKLSQALSK